MDFRQELAQFFQTPRHTLDQSFVDYACVAVILKGESLEDLQVGYIRRAIREEDRWSGQIAFPGGRKEDVDGSDLATALRETQEEIGVTLFPEELVGRLSDIQGRRRGHLLDFFIRPFVFYVERDLPVILDPLEVADYFWFPLAELLNPARKTEYTTTVNNMSLSLPAIQLEGDPPLWGLTYMMTEELLDLHKRKKP